MLPRKSSHGKRHSFIQTNSPLHENFSSYRPVSLDAIVVIHADRINNACYNIIPAYSLIERVFDVASYKSRALVVKIGWIIPKNSNIGNFLHLNLQSFFCRLFEERTGSGAAGLIHRIVRSNTICDIGVFCILTTDLKNGINLFIKEKRAGCVGDNLIDDSICYGVQTRYLSARPGNTETHNMDTVTKIAKLLNQIGITVSRCLHRIAICSQVD